MPWIIFWIVVMITLIIIEVCATNLVTIWIAIGAFFAVLVAIWFGPVAQWSVFILASSVLLIATRPLAKKFVPKTVPLNYDRVIGEVGIVIEEINTVTGLGQVKVMGQIWSAKCVAETAIPVDTSVRVNAVEGVKVIVEKIQ